jgi:DNA-directed RNA polymerase subunit K/omega
MTRPTHMGAFEFVVLASLRTAQLMRGCVPEIPGDHKHAVTAQCEIAAGLVTNTRTALLEEQPAAGPPDGATVMPDTASVTLGSISAVCT